MFEFDLSKIAVFCVVGVIVVGPKELPVAMRFLGRSLRQLGQLKTRLRSEFVRALDEADVEGMNGHLNSISDFARIDISYNAATAMRSRSTQPTEASESAKGDEPTYASPEMARYLGALPETESASPSSGNVVEFVNHPDATVSPAGGDTVK